MCCKNKINGTAIKPAKETDLPIDEISFIELCSFFVAYAALRTDMHEDINKSERRSIYVEV